jgi:glycosyltransferase involved in cell wall biosynthesis
LKKKILFISHDASLSGAPLILLNFIRWGKRNDLFEPLIVLLDGGALEADFKTLGRVWNCSGYHTNVSNYERLLSFINPELRLKVFHERILKEIKLVNPDICYANTIVSIKFFAKARDFLYLPVLLHVHEMKFSVFTYYHDILDKEIIKKVNKFIGVSNGVRDLLNFDLGVSASSIVVIPPFFMNNNSSLKVGDVDSVFTIGFSGLGNWQKGINVLPFLVKSLVDKFSSTKNLRILWMGHIEIQQQHELRFMLNKLNFDGILEITGYVLDSAVCFKRMDVFVSLSMEDSFPIACIEAIHNKLPILAFRNCGGSTDLIFDGDCGYTVPFLDTGMMADYIVDLKNNKKLQLEKGINGYNYSNNFTLNQIAPRIWEEIQQLL